MRNLLLYFSFLCLVASCKKNSQGNYKQVNISGSVFDSSGRSGLANIPVKMYWYGPGDERTNIDSTTTDAKGNYSFKTKIDLLRFSNQSLEVGSVVPKGFISLHDLEHPTVGVSIFGYSEIMSLQAFVMYQQANLSIHLEKHLADSFSEFELYYNYGGRDYWVNIDNSKPTGSVTYKVNTAAGVETNIHWSKKLTSGTTTTFKDSLICSPAISNTITLKY